MKDILDQGDISNIRYSTKFSKLSFAFSIINVTLFSRFIYLIPSNMKTKGGVRVISNTFILTMVLCVLVGFIFSIISLIKKEKLKYFKWTGVVLNSIVIFIIILSVLTFVYIGKAT